MYLHIFILTLILVAFTMLALGIKLLFDKEATFPHHSCALDDEKLNNVGGCLNCEIKEIANCAEES
ncbi:hypothetical protein [Maribellus mangrovi]|uniref:hypothetical protein n=1 Tax=Maribellus mangrovi TaxID=3133146 RepID=UPI0030EDD351